MASCCAELYANYICGIRSSQFRWFRSKLIIVLVIRFVCSTRLRRVCWRIRVTDLVCGEELSSWTDSNCVPLSDNIIFGWKIILSATACVTTAAIARHRGCNFTHFEKRSCIVKSHMCSFFDLDSVSIKFIETFCHCSWRSRARTPAGFIYNILYCRQFLQFHTYCIISFRANNTPPEFGSEFSRFPDARPSLHHDWRVKRPHSVFSERILLPLGRYFFKV